MKENSEKVNAKLKVMTENFKKDNVNQLLQQKEREPTPTPEFEGLPFSEQKVGVP